MAFLRSTIALLALLSSAKAFAPQQQTPTAIRSSPTKTTQLDAVSRQAATSFVAAAYLVANIVTTAPVFAAFDDVDFAGSSQVIAGRSGGRAGGRSSSYKSAPTSYRSSSSPTSVRSSTTVIRQPSAPTVIVAPPAPVYGGYGYNPTPGLGLGLGLSAINSIGEGMREARQENEIRESRNELTNARIKEAELEARLRQLEMAQQR